VPPDQGGVLITHWAHQPKSRGWFREALAFFSRVSLLDYDDAAEAQVLARKAARVRIGTQGLKNRSDLSGAIDPSGHAQSG